MRFKVQTDSLKTGDLILGGENLDFGRYIHPKDNETVEPSSKAVSIPGTLTGGESEETSHVETCCRVHILSQAAYILLIYAHERCTY